MSFDDQGHAVSIVEKPDKSQSNYAQTGIYFLDGSAPERARAVQLSPRGELEITTLLEGYLTDRKLRIQKMGRDYAWFDTGTHASLLGAGSFVSPLSERQGQQIGSPYEIAYHHGWIDADQLPIGARICARNQYGVILVNKLDKVLTYSC